MFSCLRGIWPQWISTAAFVFIGVFVVMFPAQALPVACCIPAIYCIYSRGTPAHKQVSILLLPVVLVVIPGFRYSGIMYGVCVLASMNMRRWVRQKMPGEAVFYPVCILSAAFGLGLVVLAVSQGVSAQDIIFRWVAKVMDEVEHLYAGVLSSGDMMDFKMAMPLIESRIVMLFPSIVVSSLAFILWANLLIVAGAQRGMNLTLWSGPQWLVYVFIVVGIFAVAFSGWLRSLGVNGVVIIAHVYFFQGLSIVAYYVHKRSWGRISRWIIYLLILSQIYLMIFVSALGLFDVWFDFRKRIQGKKGDKEDEDSID
ncbi:MAG: DUF2232 domain-containing protein [Thermodesulfobacteriota bacterium]|nr:DUF2232 domain-containing protein [Thermodesulfobacteriota bacterium]